VRVRIYKAGADEPAQTFPQIAAMPVLPGTKPDRSGILAYFAGRRK